MSGLSRREFVGGCAGGIALSSCAVSRGRPMSIPPASTRPPVIDTHVHIWSDDVAQFPFAHPFEPNFRVPKVAATAESLVAEMDAFGIDFCVLVQMIYYGWDNRYAANVIHRYPGRFRAQGLIDPTDPGAAAKLDYWVRQCGFSGIRLSPTYYRGHDEWINARESRPLWQKAEELGAIFNFFIATPQLPRLEEMVRSFPKVPVVIDHLARIDLRLADPMPEFQKLLDLAKYPNVWAKVSELSLLSRARTFPFADTYPWVRRLYDAFGPDRLMWGTGFPAGSRRENHRPPLEQELALIRTEIPFFTSEDRAKILGRNAARLWKFPAPAAVRMSG